MMWRRLARKSQSMSIVAQLDEMRKTLDRIQKQTERTLGSWLMSGRQSGFVKVLMTTVSRTSCENELVAAS